MNAQNGLLRSKCQSLNAIYTLSRARAVFSGVIITVSTCSYIAHIYIFDEGLTLFYLMWLMVRLMGGMKKSSTLSKRWPTGWVWMVWWDVLPLAWLITWCMEESHIQEEHKWCSFIRVFMRTNTHQNSPCLEELKAFCLWLTKAMHYEGKAVFIMRYGTPLRPLAMLVQFYITCECSTNVKLKSSKHTQQGRLIYLNNQMRE